MESALDAGESLRRRLSLGAAEQKRLAEEDLAAVSELLSRPFTAPPLGEAARELLVGAFEACVGYGGRAASQSEGLRGELALAQKRASDAQASLGELQAERDRHRSGEARLAEQLTQSREALHTIQGSRVWKAANLYWRGRRFLRRLFTGRSSGTSDWVGRDLAHEAAAKAAPAAVENRHDVVLLTKSADAEEGEEASSPRSPGSWRSGGTASFESRRERTTGSRPPSKRWTPCARTESLGATLALGRPTRPGSRRSSACARRRAWALSTRALPPEQIEALFPRLSVVIVTYGNLDLSRICLESLAARTEWPNLEIVVVDNGSTDGTREWLETEAQRLGPGRLRAIFHAENRGFPAACNAGLAAATGEYLVILNNDTVVTRGALTALVRHLAADPTLGLVGPVTNAIANAARVEVGYADLAGLPEWARAYVRAHDDETFALPMLALFCTALTRRTWESVGPLDERFGIGMFEDDDYCRRVAEKGLAIRCARDAFVHHWQMASFRKMPQQEYLALFAENKAKFAAKWGEAPAARSATAADFVGAQLAAVIDRVRSSRGAVIFLPSIGWGIHLVQRPHHLARVLARRGYVVIFDCTNSDDKVDGFREVEPNLFLFRGKPEILHAIPSPLALGLSVQRARGRGLPPGGAHGLRLDRRSRGLPVRPRDARAKPRARAGRGEPGPVRRAPAPRRGPAHAARRPLRAQRRGVRAVRDAGGRAEGRLFLAVPVGRRPGRRLLRGPRALVRLSASRPRRAGEPGLAFRLDRPGARPESRA